VACSPDFIAAAILGYWKKNPSVAELSVFAAHSNLTVVAGLNPIRAWTNETE
jgi:hypothetical protein